MKLRGLALIFGPILQGARAQSLVHIPDPDREGQTYLVQKGEGDTLVLTPNECFFPQFGLVAQGKGTTSDIDDLNKGESFAEIGNGMKATTSSGACGSRTPATSRPLSG